jgi:hypothetical protein
MDHHALSDLKWDGSGRRWHGKFEIAPGHAIEVAVRAGRREPAVALELARMAFPLIRPRLDEARTFAAGKLLDYYNSFNAHLRDGEQLSEAEFAARLELEAIWFTETGSSTLDFRHSLYRGQHNWEGGLIVVFARVDGTFARASWVTAADTDEWRRTRSGT